MVYRCLIVTALLSPFASFTSVAAQQPNILFILADDLAWSDLGCYGHAWHETPHLDQLAAAGIRFTDAYAPAPICSASRASILTGKTPARLHFEFVTKNGPGRQELRPTQSLRAPPFTLDLPLAERTIAERLRDAGYLTAFFGKWHLNAHYQQYLGWSPTHGPPQQGFAIAREGFGSHPYSYRANGEPDKIVEPGRFPEDSVTRGAVEFLRQPRDEPFFLMVSDYYVHTPVQTPCQWLIDKYEARIPANVKNREQRVRYAAFVETLDHYVGQLLKELDASGLRDKTLIVFTSDNGGHPEYVSNSPLRGSKWNLYEGGIRVPFIVRWPGKTPAGRTCRTPVIGYDLLPTFITAAGLTVDEHEPIDGRSLVDVLKDPQQNLDRDLIWHFPYYHPERGFAKALSKIGIDDFAISQTRPQSAMRRGKYKLLKFYEDQRTELYDLTDDLGEQHDLSLDDTTIAGEMDRSLRARLNAADARFPDPVVRRQPAK